MVGSEGEGPEAVVYADRWFGGSERDLRNELARTHQVSRTSEHSRKFWYSYAVGQARVQFWPTNGHILLSGPGEAVLLLYVVP